MLILRHRCSLLNATCYHGDLGYCNNPFRKSGTKNRRREIIDVKIKGTHMSITNAADNLSLAAVKGSHEGCHVGLHMHERHVQPFGCYGQIRPCDSEGRCIIILS